MTALTDPTLHTITTIFGSTISDTITGMTPHDWTADASGLFHTTSDLAAEWKADYSAMLHGAANTLTAIQRLEGNAEAFFENTGLAKLSAADQARDREDAQRQFDAMSGAMSINAATLGIDPTKPFTETSYLAMERTLQGNASLEELGMQGHGLNNSGISRYAGYTNDFQNNVDNATLFIGGGTLNNNHKALADFFDDNLLSHAPFAVVERNGHLVQLNQNGTAETGLKHAIVALNDSAFNRVYTADDFSTHHSTRATDRVTHAHDYTAADRASLAALAADEATPAPDGQVKTLFGDLIGNTITSTTHTWTADANGLFQTTADLATEWHNAYVDLVTTGGKDLTVEQRVEANAESVFENTGLAKLSAAQQAIDRADAQREFDAEFAAMKLAGIDPNAPLTNASYLLLEHTLQSNASLEELAIQGHGLNNPPAARYNGYTNDFQNNVDQTTLFVGRGLNHNQKAIADFFDDSILSHVPFPTVVINGHLVQLNQNANAEDCLHSAVKALNNTMHVKAYDADEYRTA